MSLSREVRKLNYVASELDCFYNLKLDCATDYAYIENPRGMTQPHHHNDFEIYFLLSGNRKYFIQNTIYTLRPNQIVIFKPNIPHQVTVNLNIPYERQLLYIAPTFFSEILNNNPSIEKIVNKQFFNLSNENFTEALGFITKINEEFKKNDKYSLDSIRNIISELLIFLDRNNDTSNIIIDKSDLRIQTAINYILEHYSEPISMSECAKVASMNYHAFSKAFQKITAIGFKEFLTRLRIDKAIELLETTTYSITKIAELVGFSSDNYFSTAFKSLHNITPREYRYKYIQQKEPQ